MSKNHGVAKQGISYQRKIQKYRPNHYACETCPDWDDVNGCWQGYDDWRKCDFDNENELPLEGEAWEEYNEEID